ncbi:S-adenosyl-L-methionine-dependent methyltransferase [Mycena chlorophos]|uniref:S-adenosyl-L-methionine-dependent methyltransferase n=1 Tax=Mycena chlorophos TaxID=658473 RepID=A0A8H6TRW5_MYCCL|nr:S-adenosyl-L-methionine-dependent methyltransferase [Mycena chlorophos]
MPTTAIRQLLEILTEAVDTLEAACQSAAVTVAIPDLYEPFSPASEAFRGVPKAAEAASLIGAAALQLEAIVTPPQISLYRVVSGHFKSAALRICLESNVTELLREAGPKANPEKLARFIRYLATHHVYREVAPNVFANTRISSMLDTLKPSKEIIANPRSKHDGTFGLAALASHHLDEAFKASAYAWETLADPQTCLSGDPTASPFARATGRPETLWTYFERPENGFAAHRFGIGMQGIEALQPPDAILNAYPWATLPQGSRVVDVGGGVGTSCLTLAREFPGLKLVNQDLPGVWNNKMPDALKSGQVVLQAHDFFTPQPQNDADVFLLKQIMHDWSDEYCVKILKHLWTAAKPDTTLLLLDSLVPLACHDPSGDSANAIPGAAPAMEAPAPLLANYGATNDMGYNADMTMFFLFNSQERTVIHFQQLLLRTGWEVVKIHRQAGDSTFLQSIEAKKMAKQARLASPTRSFSLSSERHDPGQHDNQALRIVAVGPLVANVDKERGRTTLLLSLEVKKSGFNVSSFSIIAADK